MNEFAVLSIILLVIGICLLLAMSHYYNLWKSVYADKVATVKDMTTVQKHMQGKVLSLKEDAASEVYCREGLDDFKVYIRKPGKQDILVTRFRFANDYLWAKLQAEELAEQINDKL